MTCLGLQREVVARARRQTGPPSPAARHRTWRAALTLARLRPTLPSGLETLWLPSHR